ncbi:G-protein alpha subunit-domain-containing protein [Flammula alnicola]|nr:G-protein alpha subunit-domain-containing protein [Flammula alnicola]
MTYWLLSTTSAKGNQLKWDRLTAKNKIKMLLLGAGESGKLFLKPMKHRKEIITPTPSSSYAGPRSRLAPKKDACCAIILYLPAKIEAEVLPHDVINAFRSLWCEPAVQEAVRRLRAFQLNDTTVYYLNSIDRMASPSYLPTDPQILRFHVKTTELTYKPFGGGHRSERKKGIRSFEDVSTLACLVSLSEYDQILYEDENVNLMQEVFTLFNSICNWRWFVKTSVPSIILFLNKADLVAEKLPCWPLEGSYDAARDSLHRFVSLNRSAAAKQIYVHYTCAMDMQQIQCIRPEYHPKCLLQLHLRECGLL